MTEEQEYEQYLIETGQKPAPSAAAPRVPTPLNARGRLDYEADKLRENPYATPEQIGAGAENAAALMTGGTSGILRRAGQSKAAQSVMSKLPGMARPVVENAALSGAQADGDTVDKLKAFLLGGAGTGAALGIGKLASKVGDKSMQFAVGRKKFTPGVGNELAEQGVWGTKGMMRDQVNAKVPEAWERMKSAADAIPGASNSRQIAKEIYDETTAPLTGGGTVRPSQRDVPLMHKARAFAEDIGARGAETPAQMLSRRGAAGGSAFSQASDLPLQNQMAKMSKLEQAKYSSALKGMDPTGEMAAADASYAALKRAQKPLNEERSINGMGSLMSNITQELAAPVASVVGQVGTKANKLAEFLSPLVRQASVGGTRDAGPSAEELAEYEQYLRETGQK